MKAIILAGGAGDRLWPMSRRDYPKQFIQQNNGNSLFQETIIRNIPFCDEFIIITNIKHKEIVEGQMTGFQGVSYRLILEESSKGTAPAVAYALRLLSDLNDVIVLPSDLLITGEGYSDAIYEAKYLSDEGKIVLFGVRAEEPDINYGYIRYNGNKVTRFIEKPSEALADKIFAEDNVLWNGGMILSSVATLKKAIKSTTKKIDEWTIEVISQNKGIIRSDIKTYTIKKNQMENLERTHIEKAVLEKAENLAVVPLRCRWQDISNFESYEKSSLYGKEKNTLKMACENTTVINDTERKLVVVNGIKDAFVINTEDAIYITKKELEQDIKGAMKQAPEEIREYLKYNPKTYRAWGTREIISQAPGYRVRKIELYPGCSLSAHVHQRRTEGYSVIKGELSIELKGVNRVIRAGENINILPNQLHRLYNAADETAVIIEVDTGEEIDEQDMVHQDEMENDSKLPSLYKLSPIFKDYLWGGNRLVRDFGKKSPYDITAESWELSAHKDGQSVITGGQFDGMAFGDFVREYGTEVCGWKSRTFDRFPILIKFIDALNPLSVQIHPFDDYAFVHEKEFGKNEVWYVMDAKPDSYLYCGFKVDVTKEEIRRRLADNTITEILNKVYVNKGDVIFIPAGTIHAIGAGVLICEIQQNSNSTYRVYDYDRVDKNGRKRDLHIEKAMDVITTSAYKQDAFGLEEAQEIDGQIVQQLCLCKYFQCKKYTVDGCTSIYMDNASFVSIVLLSGSAKITVEAETLEVNKGDSIFVSAGRKTLRIEGECEFILTNI
ncbi:MAG: cupin domain-containing protein [Lachnospiraceae bacterium]|nr:cupin domain-containing protein [Lachnospiraceae bacterium]